jgi:hypothetical protein
MSAAPQARKKPFKKSNKSSMNTMQHASPIWEIIDAEQQKSGFNHKTGRPFNLYSDYYHRDVNPKVIWPDLFIFLDKNHSFKMYNDIVRGGYVAGGVPIDSLENYAKLDLPNLPGLHGACSEQNVPLCFFGKDIKQGSVFNNVVSTLDIIPTIFDLNGWEKDEMPDMQGCTLIDLVKE